MSDSEFVTNGLNLESKVTSQCLRRYYEFLNQVFPGANRGWPAPNYSGHVLTFNYDRMFEAAFRERFNFDTQGLGFYGELGLNAGLDIHYNRQIKFCESRFSFLKLHGSVGMWAFDAFDDVCHQYSLPRINETQEITDQMFYQRNGETDKPRQRTAFPLLFFPHQRHFVLAQDNRYPFNAYAREVWKRAEELISNASQIRVIGYSFTGIDQKPFLDLLGKAKRCTRIVVQSPGHADELCARIGSNYPDFRNLLEPAAFAF